MTHVSIISAHPISSQPGKVKSTFSPELESELCTLAALWQAQEQQREPLASNVVCTYAGRDGDTELPGDYDNDVRTDQLHPPSNDGNAPLIKNFLDKLAELLCCRKDPKMITSTAMAYSEEQVTILAARNSKSEEDCTWTQVDVKLLEALATVLERVSADG